MNSDRLARALYSVGWCLALPLVFGYLLWRSIRQPAYREHWLERLGGSALPPPRQLESSALVWIHAVSVGETRAVAPLLLALARRDPRSRFLLTHTTPTGRATGAEISAGALGDRVSQCYLPYDLPWAVAAFLKRWQPSCGLLIETEVWPNLAALCYRQGVPLTLVNGRLSQRSLVRGRRQACLIRPALARLRLVLVQTVADGERLLQLGRRADGVCGNLKYDIEPPAAKMAQGRQWRALFGARPVVLAASTRDGEEALLLAAWQRQVADLGTLLRPLLIIVPRHPQRFQAVAEAIARATERMARRSALERSDAAAYLAASDILLGDSMGEMPAWYASADVAIIGGSLLPFGAQNLIEANAVGCPVVLGPSRFNFAQAAAASLAAGAAAAVADANEAVATSLAIAQDADRRRRMAAAARAFTQQHRGATARTLAYLELLLPAVQSQ